MNFTDQQLAAITATGPRIAVVAGPGAGKTLVLTERVKHLCASGVDSARIVCITLTNTAAREISERLDCHGQIGYVGTLHGFCLKIITRVYGDVTVMEPEVATTLAEQVTKELGVKMSVSEIQSLIETRLLGNDATGPKSIAAKAYLHRMCQMKCFDYSALLRLGLEHANTYAELYDHLLIDEAQDHSRFDWEIYRRTGIPNHFSTGDPDQSIFQFRNASVERFLDEIKSSAVFPLEENHRSANIICDIAQTLIAHNEVRFEKNTFSKRFGGRVSYLWSLDFREMADEIKNEIDQWQQGSYAVLCRYNEHVNEMGQALVERGIIVRIHNENVDRVEHWYDPNAVDVLTIHGAKGKEWDCIFVPYFNEGVYPSTRNVEECRRLAYVAFTRARERLIVLAGSRPSPFVREAGLDKL